MTCLRLNGSWQSQEEKLGPQTSTHMLWVALPSPPSGSDFRGPERLAPCTLIRQIIFHLFPADFLKPTPAAPTLHYRQVWSTCLTRASALSLPSQLQDQVVFGTWGNSPRKTWPQRDLIMPGCTKVSAMLCPKGRWAFRTNFPVF